MARMLLAVAARKELCGQRQHGIHHGQNGYAWKMAERFIKIWPLHFLSRIQSICSKHKSWCWQRAERASNTKTYDNTWKISSKFQKHWPQRNSSTSWKIQRSSLSLPTIPKKSHKPNGKTTKNTGTPQEYKRKRAQVVTQTLKKLYEIWKDKHELLRRWAALGALSFEPCVERRYEGNDWWSF